jgi:hypothetical protein
MLLYPKKILLTNKNVPMLWITLCLNHAFIVHFIVFNLT